ncbi:glycoside hydrolase family 28 protein [Desertivirga arenae]|uniref:glycoside hydrolase family 28 protein n=1 Tax=Desertivirga arenae TaxID=2810309 RepID=UPI001A96497D|nr:glycoside hydrolase family 28 protein [Pedobacter sp. SYSU D00823]
MKRYLFFCFCLLIFSSTYAKDQDPKWTKKVGSAKLSFRKAIYNVNNYGAVSDGKTLNTEAIQKAIDDCAVKGGGTVTFKPGKYLSGAVFVKEGVHFRIDKGVELLGSSDIKHFPEIDTRIAGIEMPWPAALINIIKQNKAAVSGDGIVNAQGKPYWDYYWNLRKEYEAKGLRWIVDYDAKRPRMFLAQESSNILLSGITFQQAGFWTVQILYSDHVTIDGITIQNNIGGHGPSTDGIDIDSSTWVLIQNSDIDCNDDNFCLKSGRDWDGLRVNKPTEYVLIQNCVARAGAGLLTLGSETAGSIRHVMARNLKGNGTSNGLNIKSATTRGGIVEDIHFKNIELKDVGVAVRVSMNWNPAYSYSTLPAGYNMETVPQHWKVMLTKVEPVERGIPKFKDVHMSNITVDGAKGAAIVAEGLKNSLLSNFTFDNFSVSNATKAGSVSFAEGWKISGTSILTKDGSKVTVKNSTNVSF